MPGLISRRNERQRNGGRGRIQKRSGSPLRASGVRMQSSKAGNVSVANETGENVNDQPTAVAPISGQIFISAELLRGILRMAQGRKLVNEHLLVAKDFEASLELWRNRVLDLYTILAAQGNSIANVDPAIANLQKEIRDAEVSFAEHALHVQRAERMLKRGGDCVAAMALEVGISTQAILGQDLNIDEINALRNEIFSVSNDENIDLPAATGPGPARTSCAVQCISKVDQRSAGRKDVSPPSRVSSMVKPCAAQKAPARPDGPRGALPKKAIDILNISDEAKMMSAFRQWNLDDYRETQEQLNKLRSDYRRLRDMHSGGQDPGLPGWSAQWTREEFDIAHLRECMHISGLLVNRWSLFMKVMRTAAKNNVAPATWQDREFYQPGDFGYSTSEVQALVAGAPREEIGRWFMALPSDEEDLGGPAPISDAPYNPGAYAGEHPPEWPGDQQALFEGEPELEFWDSSSARAYPEDRSRVDFYGGGGKPLGWTWNAETRMPPPE